MVIFTAVNWSCLTSGLLSAHREGSSVYLCSVGMHMAAKEQPNALIIMILITVNDSCIHKMNLIPLTVLQSI